MHITRGLHERGDTIVEVLLAVAIISFILTVAYVITSRSVLDLQNNAERVQARHLVESQIESLKANDGLSGGTCFDVNGAPTSGSSCNRTTEGSGATYQLSVTDSSNLYTVKATWTALGATHAPANVTMYYRLKQ